MQATACWSDQTGRRVDQRRVDVIDSLRRPSGGNIDGETGNKAPLVHRPQQIAARVEILPLLRRNS